MSQTQGNHEQLDLARRAIRGSQAAPAGVAPAPPAIQRAVINQSTATTADVIPGQPGQAIEILEIFCYTDTAMALEWLDGAVSLTGSLNGWPANSGFFFPNTGEPHWRLTPGNALRLTTGSAGQVSGFVLYRMVG